MNERIEQERLLPFLVSRPDVITIGPFPPSIQIRQKFSSRIT